MTGIEDRQPDQAPEPYDSWVARATGAGTSLGKSLLLPTLAVITALIIGAVIIALSDPDNVKLLFSDTPTALRNMWDEVVLAYTALFRGSIGSVNAISETLFAATPLLLAGLGVALGFRAGLFNIGAQGQMIMGAIVATYVGIYVTAPAWIHIPLTLLAGLVGGLLWGGLAGLLKARTGAHEVITTIMFNFIALYFVQWILTTPGLQDPGRNNPVSAAIQETARLPKLFGTRLSGHHRVPGGPGRRVRRPLAALPFLHRIRVPGGRLQSSRRSLRRDECRVRGDRGNGDRGRPRRGRRSQPGHGSRSLQGVTGIGRVSSGSTPSPWPSSGVPTRLAFSGRRSSSGRCRRAAARCRAQPRFPSTWWSCSRL